MYEVKEDLSAYKLLAFLKRSSRALMALAEELPTTQVAGTSGVSIYSHVRPDSLNQNIPYVETAVHELFTKALVDKDADAIASLTFLRGQYAADNLAVPVKVTNVYTGLATLLNDSRLESEPRAVILDMVDKKFLAISTNDYVMRIEVPTATVIATGDIVFIQPVLDADKNLTGFELLAETTPV